MQLYWTANTVIALISFDFWIWFVIVPSFITFHSYSLTNCLNHFRFMGYQNYESKDNSVNSPWLFPFVLGECWHNNHHGDAKNYSTKYKPWEIDPLAWLINLIKTK